MFNQNSSSSEDSLLLNQIKGGNKAAFDSLYQKYWKQAFNSAYKRLNDSDRAQDVIQDVFTQLWIRREEIEIENIGAYLHIAVRNKVFNLIDKEERYTAMPDLIFQLENAVDRADAKLLHRELIEALEALIATLPLQQQTIFRLRHYEGLTTAEIASKLQISPKTVRNLLGRSLAKLRKSIFLILLFSFL
ncbi:RNA polymerase sigma factor [Solitalea canadensis]|uniref:RNA polymerase sigma-70 factor, Bacteroides expansion family 1 n=1 Tax=Solitalea canadensis (strain ATCC 29591 / DSM 3403 / JCM 21819 / LMG 8368 / NBRC 15130 / NCIMB 12057 / USAM 9D) TaxID=929556 RepID=H8KXK1_SOLCM|nr:RNA polymerase sigma-70 factor [Solitalea canadensis]AFD05297.1 RNA polymerase sigma-70 factor, Bacteroides expansion family 1 [Solitalea canadensis DSM 3403]